MAVYAATSPRLHLQSISEDLHLHDKHLINSDPQSMFWSTRKASTDIEETRAQLRASLPTPEKPWNERWAILLRQPNEEEETPVKLRMIGEMAIVREQEVGYGLHPDFWGKGYMSEALEMFIKMFWTMEINEKYDILLAAADPENSASMRVLEKAGFKKGEYRKDFYERAVLGGKKSDLQCYYIERPRKPEEPVSLRRKRSKEVRFGAWGIGVWKGDSALEA